MTASFSTDEIIAATGGCLSSGTFTSMRGKIVWCVDDICPGDWFIYIPEVTRLGMGEQLDAAVLNGACGLIVSGRHHHNTVSPVTVINVSDTRRALLDLVECWRQRVNPRVVGVSGNSGRRATMVLLHQLIRETSRTHVAFMHDLGRTGCARDVLSMPENTELLIFEAGGMERGDIKSTAIALKPDIAVLTQIRHPLPSAEYSLAAIYCELIEALTEHPQERVAAVVYDQNLSVQRRVDETIGSLTAQKYSLSGRSISHRVTQGALDDLNEVMYAVTGQNVSRSELWCAVETAKALGLSSSTLEEIFEIQDEAETVHSTWPENAA